MTWFNYIIYVVYNDTKNTLIHSLYPGQGYIKVNLEVGVDPGWDVCLSQDFKQTFNTLGDNLV